MIKILQFRHNLVPENFAVVKVQFHKAKVHISIPLVSFQIQQGFTEAVSDLLLGERKQPLSYPLLRPGGGLDARGLHLSYAQCQHAIIWEFEERIASISNSIKIRGASRFQEAPRFSVMK